MSDKAEKKTDRRTIYTRKQITEAYLSLLSEMPKNKIKVTEICRRAEINRCTFYLHFEDINAVEQAIEEDLLKKFKAYVHGQMYHKEGRLQLSTLFLDQILDDPAYRTLMLGQTDNPFLSQMRQIFREDLVMSLPQSHHLSDRQKQLLYQFIAGGVMAVQLEWLRNGHDHIQEENHFLDHLVQTAIQIDLPPDR